uniref:Integral membrane protein 2 n=1 Tax=Sinocyclocheilus rhinocerous TaxID=307959 RepID=A0A673H937_9TELE
FCNEKCGCRSSPSIINAHKFEIKGMVHPKNENKYVIPNLVVIKRYCRFSLTQGLTAYYDIALDKCYVIELNTTIVMPPRNLWELLVNVKRGMYLPQTYIIQEEMVVTGRVRNMRQLGPFIHRLCYGKEIYRLRRRSGQRRVDKRETRNCHSIRHFENTFVVETKICDRLLL